MKKLAAIAVLVLVLVLVLQLVSFACPPPPDPPCPPPPPPPCEADCSPGFWKNHTEIWMGDFAADYDWMIAGLTAKGWEDNFADRWVATDMLNAAYPDANCH